MVFTLFMYRFTQNIIFLLRPSQSYIVMVQRGYSGGRLSFTVSQFTTGTPEDRHAVAYSHRTNGCSLMLLLVTDHTTPWVWVLVQTQLIPTVQNTDNGRSEQKRVEKPQSCETRGM